ncbi:MAG TPA: hypothetical protein VD862_04705, partial [Candidatus Paceibacterota bacterium]|nr:hypothetical protein [Candidatus Paceibacterota bacterium]
MKTKKIVSIITSVATVAATTGAAFLPLAAGAQAPVCGQLELQWDGSAGGTGDFFPAGIATTNAGLVYVGDADTHVRVYDSGGSFLRQYSAGTVAVPGPGGVAVNNSTFDSYVSITNEGTIERFNGSDVFQNRWGGSSGTGDGQFFSYARGIVLDSSGNVYATDFQGARVQKFSSTGVFLGWWGKDDLGGTGFHAPGSGRTAAFGSEDGAFFAPAGIARDWQNNIYVADQGNNRIQKFDANGNFLGKWGTAGAGNGQFNGPVGVAVGPTGDRVYVVEFGGRVQVFSNTGAFQSSWQTGYTQTFSIAVDNAEKVYIGAQNDGLVLKYTGGEVCDATPTPTPGPAVCGDFLLEWGTSGSGDANGLFEGPSGVAGDADGKVYVVDGSNENIQVFNPDGTAASPVSLILDGENIEVTVSGGKIYTVDGDDDALRIYDATSGVLLNNVNVGGLVSPVRSVDHDSAGNIMVMGIENGNSNNTVVGKYDANGTFISSWTLADHEDSNGLAVDRGDADAVYVATKTREPQTFPTPSIDHFKVLKFTPSGSPLPFAAPEAIFQGNNGTTYYSVEADGTGRIYVVENSFSGGLPSDAKIRVFDRTGSLVETFGTFGAGTGQLTVARYVGFGSTNAVYITDNVRDRILKYQGCAVVTPPPPPLSQCAITALQAMGLNPGDFPNLDSALDDACEAAPGNVTTITAGNEPPNNYKMAPGEVVVLGEGAHISNNLIGDNGTNNALFLGNNVTIDGNSLKTEAIWVGGTGNLINGNVNHAVDINVGPNAYLRVNGNINDLQNLNIGSGGTLSVGGNVDIYVSADIASGGLLEVDGNLDCNGAPTVNNNGTVTAGTNNCTLLAAASGGGSGGWAMYLPLLALAALGLAIYVKPRK